METTHLVDNTIEQLATFNILHDQVQLVSGVKYVEDLYDVWVLNTPRNIDLCIEMGGGGLALFA